MVAVVSIPTVHLRIAKMISRSHDNQVRRWPNQVAVPATECRGSLGRFMDAFCLDLSVCERHYSVFHEDKWWIVYRFADPEHAEKFRIRFGGERFNPKDRGRGANERGGTR